jgi:N-formylglutamate deformylase
MTELYVLERGDAPLMISIPHLGTQIPEALRGGYTDTALTLVDTDWHLDRLYGFAREMGATILGARYSRYVIDLNRPRNDESLYPGQTTTGLFPLETFRGEPLYREGCVPDAAERERRIVQYWQPYHAALQTELQRLRARHKHVLLWEAHSIASVLPRLFDDKLPDLNIGTQDGRTAAAAIQQAVEREAAASDYTSIANGRFKGGYITRHFGAPHEGVHTVQLEMCQSTYMSEQAPFDYLPAVAQQVEPVVRRMVGAALAEIEVLNAAA